MRLVSDQPVDLELGDRGAFGGGGLDAPARPVGVPGDAGALAVRGGEMDPLQIGKGIIAASGVYGAFDPKANLEKYGCKNIGDSGKTLMRAGALGQLVFAAALNMDTENVHGQRDPVHKSNCRGVTRHTG